MKVLHEENSWLKSWCGMSAAEALVATAEAVTIIAFQALVAAEFFGPSVARAADSLLPQAWPGHCLKGEVVWLTAPAFLLAAAANDTQQVERQAADAE